MEIFVTFTIAKKLKEKGFKEQCLAYYTKDSDFYYNTSYGSDIENAFKSFNSRPNHICGKRIDAPTISQVMKWLRDTHNIHINVGFVRFNGNTELYWVFSVENIKDDVEYDWLYSISHDTYEECALVGIEYVLDNLI